jgi:hypothetical protein
MKHVSLVLLPRVTFVSTYRFFPSAPTECIFGSSMSEIHPLYVEHDTLVDGGNVVRRKIKHPLRRVPVIIMVAD